jgi:NADH-quinone oxidoreductase subunit J
MSGQLILFLVLAAIAVAAAVNLILQRQPIHSVLSLIVVMVALAGLYLLLEAEFVAAVQIIVYAGAIMVLFIFVIMLLNAGAEERTRLSRVAYYIGVPGAVFFLGELAWQVARASAPLSLQPVPQDLTHGLAILLFRDFAFPFELTSLLILIALLGALVLAQRGASERLAIKGAEKGS